jgi:hypothetical protein
MPSIIVNVTTAATTTTTTTIDVAIATFSHVIVYCFD